MIITMWSERGYRVVTQRSSKFSKSKTAVDIVVVNQVLQIMLTRSIFFEKNRIFENSLTLKASFFVGNCDLMSFKGVFVQYVNHYSLKNPSESPIFTKFTNFLR